MLYRVTYMLTKTHGLIAICQIFVALSALYLIVGLIKPKWVWLGDREPGRHIIVSIALVMFMASWSGYSALTLKSKEQLQAERRQALQEQAVQTQAVQPPVAPQPETPVQPTPVKMPKTESLAPAVTVKPAVVAPTAVTKSAAVAPKAKPTHTATPKHETVTKPKRWRRNVKPEPAAP